MIITLKCRLVEINSFKSYSFHRSTKMKSSHSLFDTITWSIIPNSNSVLVLWKPRSQAKAAWVGWSNWKRTKSPASSLQWMKERNIWRILKTSKFFVIKGLKLNLSSPLLILYSNVCNIKYLEKILHHE